MKLLRSSNGITTGTRLGSKPVFHHICTRNSLRFLSAICVPPDPGYPTAEAVSGHYPSAGSVLKWRLMRKLKEQDENENQRIDLYACLVCCLSRRHAILEVQVWYF